MSAIQLQVLSYHPSTKLVALMGWVEGPLSTLISSDLKFVEASENARAQPTTNHLTTDTTVSRTIPTHVRAQNTRGFCSRHGMYLPKSTNSGFFVHAKSQIPPNPLNRNYRVSSFYKTRGGSKLCFLTCFSYFSCYLLYLVFSQNCYSLISFLLSWQHGSPTSCPISHTFGTLSWYVIHALPYFWHRTRRFLEARHSWEPGSRLTASDLSPFHLLLKVSAAIVHWVNTNHTFLAHKNPQTDTFLHDISPAKLHSTDQVRNPQGISKLVNKVNCWVLHALLKAIVQAFLATNPLQRDPQRTPALWLASQSQSQGTSFLWMTVVPNGSEAPWMWHAIARGWSLSVLLLRFSGSGA